MKKLCLLFISISACFAVKAAEDTTTLTNLLQAPASPAANILGVAPSDIARPTDPSAVMITALEATRGFNSFPSSFAVDIAPGWLFAGRHIKYDDLKKDVFGKTIWQNLVLSAGYVNSLDSVSGKKDKEIGLGLKMSFLRGNLNPEIDTMVMRIDTILSRRVNARSMAKTALVENNSTIIDLKNKRLQALHDGNAQVANIYAKQQDSVANMIMTSADFQQYVDSVNTSAKEDKDRLRAMIKKIDWQRHGATLDLTIGTALNFPDLVFDNGYMQRAGVWLTGGYTTQSGFAALGIVRYLYHPDKVYADEKGTFKQDNLSTADGGVKLLYANDNSNFTFSGEAIYRSVLNKSDVDATWKFTVNADYEFSQNKILTLSFGRDFDGKFYKDGNVIAMINLIIGFGNAVRMR